MMRRVRCRSGLMGWQERLQKVYGSLQSFRQWNSLYGIAKRLGFRSAVSAWRANPVVRGSVSPTDLEVVRATKK